MKKIDEILENLAMSIGSRLIQEYENKNYKLEIIGLCTMYSDDRLFITSEKMTTLGLKLLTYLLDLSLSSKSMKFVCKGKQYYLNNEKFIFEPVEELKPCIYCNGILEIQEDITKTFAGDGPILIFRTYCKHVLCYAAGSWFFGEKQDAIRKHNEMYRKIYLK